MFAMLPLFCDQAFSLGGVGYRRIPGLTVQLLTFKSSLRLSYSNVNKYINYMYQDHQINYLSLLKKKLTSNLKIRKKKKRQTLLKRFYWQGISKVFVHLTQMS